MRRIASLALLVIAACSAADFAPALVAISVGDVKATEAWYERNLGFALKSENVYAEVTVAILEREGFQLELVQLQSSVPPAQVVPGTNPARIRGFGKLAFRVRDIEAMVARLRANGVKFVMEPRDDLTAGTRSFIVLDNEGNWIQLVGPIPAPTVPDAAKMTL